MSEPWIFFPLRFSISEVVRWTFSLQKLIRDKCFSKFSYSRFILASSTFKASLYFNLTSAFFSCIYLTIRSKYSSIYDITLIFLRLTSLVKSYPEFISTSVLRDRFSKFWTILSPFSFRMYTIITAEVTQHHLLTWFLLSYEFVPRVVHNALHADQLHARYAKVSHKFLRVMRAEIGLLH